MKNITYNINQVGKEINFVWVKSHIGWKYNERINVLAKEATTNETLLSQKICLTNSYSVCKNIEKERGRILGISFAIAAPAHTVRSNQLFLIPFGMMVLTFLGDI